MRKLGQLLVQDGIISAAQLDEGLQSQVAFGGRLGTNLAELEFASLDQIAAYLGKQQRLKVAPQDWIDTVDAATLRSVPLNFVRRFKVLPMRVDEHFIHLAMLDPSAPHH